MFSLKSVTKLEDLTVPHEPVVFNFYSVEQYYYVHPLLFSSVEHYHIIHPLLFSSVEHYHIHSLLFSFV